MVCLVVYGDVIYSDAYIVAAVFGRETRGKSLLRDKVRLATSAVPMNEREATDNRYQNT